jgi:hypothetical protein
MAAGMRGPPATFLLGAECCQFMPTLLQFLRYLIQVTYKIKAYTKCRDEYPTKKIKR